jgi:putative toxin-antitoxin system antitoxin component (TIGR02293 family)
MTSSISEGSKAKMARRKRIRAAREQARKVFGTAEAAKEWLESECPALGFVRPIDLLNDDEGLKNVIAILVRIEHGVFS